MRIDQTYRGIVLKPEQGAVYMLMWVDKHDEAYDWARRHDCAIHPLTGAIQVVDTSYIKAVPEAAPVSPTAAKSQSYFRHIQRSRYWRWGFLLVFIAQVMDLTEIAEFNQLQKVMPAEAWEPLHWLTEGLDYPEVLAEFNDHPEEPVDTQ